MKNLLSVNQLTCDRGGVVLFRQFSLELRAGDFFHITGPNGCGKTSLLRILAGLTSPVAGEIKREYDELLYLGHRIGIKKRLTPVENLRWYFPQATDNQIADALDYWQLSGYDEVLCEHLSAGQQQRVALCRLLMSRADCWILDEPATAIDQQGLQQLESCIEDKINNGGAVLLTSHHSFAGQPKPEEIRLREYAA